MCFCQLLHIVLFLDECSIILDTWPKWTSQELRVCTLHAGLCLFHTCRYSRSKLGWNWRQRGFKTLSLWWFLQTRSFQWIFAFPICSCCETNTNLSVYIEGQRFNKFNLLCWRTPDMAAQYLIIKLQPTATARGLGRTQTLQHFGLVSESLNPHNGGQRCGKKS